MWLSGFEAVGFAGNRQGVFARRCASDWTGRVVNVSSAAQLRFKSVKKTCARSIGSSLRVILVRVISELEAPCDLPPTYGES